MYNFLFPNWLINALGKLPCLVVLMLTLTSVTVFAQNKPATPTPVITQPVIIVPAAPASQTQTGVVIETPNFETSVATTSQPASSGYVPPRKLTGALWVFLLTTPIVIGIYLGYQLLVYLFNRRRDWSKARLR